MGGAQRATFQLGRADLDSVSLHSLGAPPKVKVKGQTSGLLTLASPSRPEPCQGPDAPGPRIPPGRCAWRKALPRAVRGFCAPKFYGLAASKSPGRLSSARGEKSKDFRGTTRDFRTRSRAFPHSLHQGWAYNAAARPTPTKRWQAAPLGRETQGPVYAPRRLPACTTRRLSERRLRRLLPVIVFSYFPL